MTRRGLTLPNSEDELSKRLKELHDKRKEFPRLPRNSSLTQKQRKDVLKKTGGRCHLCGGKIKGNKFAADHILSHAAGGKHDPENYLAAHSHCNGARWFYSEEEVQWILRMGVWARKQMEDRTSVGREMLKLFYRHETSTRKRRVSVRTNVIPIILREK
jgi:hypothetical protein